MVSALLPNEDWRYKSKNEQKHVVGDEVAQGCIHFVFIIFFNPYLVSTLYEFYFC